MGEGEGGGEGMGTTKGSKYKNESFYIRDSGLLLVFCVPGMELGGGHTYQQALSEQTHIRNFCSASMDAVGSLAYCSLTVYTPVNA